ncbi:YadA C-terminal domain-containing protein, partial [Vibrio owensii]
ALTRAKEDAALSTRINDNSTRITDLDNKFTGEVERLDQRIDTIEWKIEDVEKRMSGGIAATAAIAGMVQPKYVDETMVSVGTGYYNGQSALAIGITHNYSEKTAFKFAAAADSASDWQKPVISASVGFSF